MTVARAPHQHGVVDTGIVGRGQPTGAVDVVVLGGDEPVLGKFPAQAEGQVLGVEAVPRQPDQPGAKRYSV